jgi:hypothetical protein
MDKHTLENWKKIEQSLREAGKTDCYFYKRALIILKGGKDPLR